MRKELSERLSTYRAVNDITLKGEIVVFGSTFMANFPFYELSQKYLMHNAVYNRSIEDLTLAEAEEILSESVLEVKPAKVFLSLGEKDLGDPAALSAYHRIVRKITAKLPNAKLYLLPVQASENTENEGDRSAFNENLRQLAERTGAVYLDLPEQLKGENLYKKVFKRLNCFFHGSKLSFSEAFSYAD